MPASKRPKPLYQRGDFRLYAREGRNLEIVWYDEAAGRERSVSTGTTDVEVAIKALDKRWLKARGSHFCPNCGQEMQGEEAPLLLSAIADYLVQTEGQAGHKKSTKPRLGKVVRYIAETDASVTVPAVNADWVEAFRVWLTAQPTKSKSGKILKPNHSPGGVEGCVLQLAAAINATPGHKAQFQAGSVKEAANTPAYRAPVTVMADMFRFCLDPARRPSGELRSEKERAMVIATRTDLLRYLRAAVATWARPDAIYDLKPQGQWHAEARVLNLNPPGRRQTKKYRPIIPVARQFAPWLDEALGRDNYLPVTSIHHSWDVMSKELGLPKDGEAGEKLIRRSMATIARKMLGEERWPQGKMMLGHVKADTSDIYALPDPANLGAVLAVTEAIIDEIEKLCSGAFTAGLPQSGPVYNGLKVVENG